MRIPENFHVQTVTMLILLKWDLDSNGMGIRQCPADQPAL